MELTTNFALVLRPNRVYMPGAGKNIVTIVKRHDSKFFVEHEKLREDPIDTILATEAELWDYVYGVPWIQAEFDDSLQLAYRGLGLRAQLFERFGEVGVAKRQDELNETILFCNATLLTALGATRLTRAAPKIIRAHRVRNVSSLMVGNKVELSFHPGKTEVKLSMFPNPIVSNEWSIRVQCHSLSNEQLVEFQQRTEDAFEHLRSKGIRVGDVITGTSLEL